MAPSPDPERAQCFMGARGHQSIVIGAGKEGNTADWRGRVASPAWGAGRRLGVDKVLGKEHLPPPAQSRTQGGTGPIGLVATAGGDPAHRPGPLLHAFHGVMPPTPNLR